MSAQAPEPGPDDEPATPSPSGAEPVPSPSGAQPVPLFEGGQVVAGGGLLDLQVLLDALAAGGFLVGPDEDPDELAAMAGGRLGPRLSAGQVAALAVEHMDPGPALAGWLDVAASEADCLNEYGLTGVAFAGQKLASWAQAAELAAVAQVASRAAAADKNIGVGVDGRPARVCRDATGQVSLALTMSDSAAAAWADLAVTLSWRLPATGQALAAGQINLYRARRIAEATSVLSEAKAREVEAKILPGAGQLTPAKLRERLRRAVIAADPDAAERSRADAERDAGVSLYPDDNGTATLTGTGLPTALAAAAMARITAMARARKAAGLGGGLDLHRAQVMLGLLLETLPPTPPPQDAPPDQPPGGDSDSGPEDSDGHGDSDGNHGDSSDPAPGDPSPAGPGSDPGPSSGRSDSDGGGSGESSDPGPDGPADDVPFPGDEDAPPEDGLDDGAGDAVGGYCAGDEDDLSLIGPTPEWPELGAIPPALARPAVEPDGRPVAGLLDVTLPWATLAGLPGGGPGVLGRIGPITPVQARQLAAAAVGDPAAQWRIIVTNAEGQAIAVTRIRRPRSRAGPGPGRDGPPRPLGLIGRVTLTISRDSVDERARGLNAPVSGLSEQAAGRAGGPGPPLDGPGPPQGGPGPPLAGIGLTALRAAIQLLERARVQAAADAVAGGCAHADESPGYRPPPRLREYIAARDVTCRSPVCGQPAWRADLDHTIPYDQGGRTCRCNTGGGCRRHHQLKQHPRWKLEQTKPGVFTWTTPAGRTYTTGPDSHPL
jgi:Domain of unknown function (DUF222)